MPKCENVQMLIGFLGKDPRVKDTTNSAVAHFDMATTDSWKDKATGEWKEETEWHHVEAWGYLAGRVRRDFHKGAMVRVIGKTVTEKWQDKETKQERQRKIVKASDVYLLVPKGGPRAPQQKSTDSEQAPPDDDLPF